MYFLVCLKAAETCLYVAQSSTGPHFGAAPSGWAVEKSGYQHTHVTAEPINTTINKQHYILSAVEVKTSV